MSITDSISSSELRALKTVSWSKGVALLLSDWIIMTVSVVVFMCLNQWFLYPVLVVVIGSRMMGLWALLHDGHHGMLVKSKWLNRKLTEWFIAWPLFKSLEEYDEQHRSHHKFLGATGDPNFNLLRYEEFQFPMNQSKLFSILIKDLLGVNFVFYRMKGLLKNPLVLVKKISGWNLDRVFLVAIISLSTIYFNIWQEVLFFWIVPLVTYFQFLVRVTLISDHCFADNTKSKARTVKLNWFERTFMVPHNLNFHYEHHHFGGIPSYNLPKLQQKLRKNSAYARASDYSQGYLEVFRKMTVSS